MNAYVLVALAAIAAVELADARVVHRLERSCAAIGAGKPFDGRLLRWYSEGFERPLRVAQLLCWASALVGALCLLSGTHPALTASAFVLLGLSVYQLRHAAQRRRFYHLRAHRHDWQRAGLLG